MDVHPRGPWPLERKGEDVGDLGRLLEERDRRIADLEEALVQRETELDAILSSRSWKICGRLRSLRARLAPEGSRRYRWFERLVRVVLAGPRWVGRTWASLRSRVRLVFWRLAPSRGGSLLTLQSMPPVQPLPREHPAVDIVVCVHNALDDVRNCLESLIRCTSPPYGLILVDDGSDQSTAAYLAAFAESQGVELLRSAEATGYTRAANRGLRRTAAPYVVLLNSDTVLTTGWLDRLVRCAVSDTGCGMVGPVSNTASWQSVPHVFAADGDWAANPLPEGLGPEEMAELVAMASGCTYPRLPFLNGFCLLITRQVLDRVGLLDEESFPRGFGEENDLCLRARQAGFHLAVADDAFVYHAHSRSYSIERRRRLVAETDAVLAAKHGPALVAAGAEACRWDPVMAGQRIRVAGAPRRLQVIADGRTRWEGKRVLFLLPIAEPGGGGHVVVQEAMAMVRMGVDVRLLNLSVFRRDFERSMPDLDIPVHWVRDPQSLAHLAGGFDAVVATVFHSVDWLRWVPEGQGSVRGYYVQDFEPRFFPETASDHRTAMRSYTRFPDLVCFTKTEWNRRQVQEATGVESAVVGPSVDTDLFRPRPSLRGADGVVRVAAMVRPSTPRRQPVLTMEVLRRFAARHHGAAEVILFGCQATDAGFQRLNTRFAWRHAGVLTRSQLARLLAQVDIFADFSSFQAMGLTALEAMASGAAVVIPREGGGVSFARDGENAVMVDTTDAAAGVAALDLLVQDSALRRRLQLRALADACAFPPEDAAFRVLETLFATREGAL